MPSKYQPIIDHKRANPNSTWTQSGEATGYKGKFTGNGKGGVKPRTGDRKGQASRRNGNLKRSTPPLTEEQKRSNANQQRRHRHHNGKIGNYADKKTVGHKEPAWKSGQQHERLEETHGKDHADDIRDKNHKAREQVGGGLGDHPGNRQTETMGENGKANGEYEQLEGALGEMERRKPSNPDNPSANYFQKASDFERFDQLIELGENMWRSGKFVVELGVGVGSALINLPRLLKGY